MPCLGPLTAYYPAGADGSPSKGAGRLVFDKRKAHSGVPILVGCGQCIECKLEHAREWSVRMMHEKRMSNAGSSFLTLTYDNGHLPDGGTLVLEDLQKFLKRLRHVTGPGLRYYGCGEYGETFGRPHYHLLLFNYAFTDKKLHSRNKRGEPLFTSETLSSLWTDGHSLVGDVTFDSCMYVAGYVTKKIVSKHTVDFKLYNWETGTVRLPEFPVMSLHPGLGASYCDRYADELLRDGFVLLDGYQSKLPRFYVERLREKIDQNVLPPSLVDRSRLAVLKRKRLLEARKLKPDDTLRRRRVRELVRFARLANNRKKEL